MRLLVLRSLVSVLFLLVLRQDIDLLERQERLVRNLLRERRDIVVVDDLDAV